MDIHRDLTLTDLLCLLAYKDSQDFFWMLFAWAQLSLTEVLLLETSLGGLLMSCIELRGFPPSSALHHGAGLSLLGFVLGTWASSSVHPGSFCLDLQRYLRAPPCPVPDKALGIDPEAASVSQMLAFCRAGHSLGAPTFKKTNVTVPPKYQV